MPRLTEQSLSSLHPDVSVPTYDRAGLTTGVVHLGVGGFHRAHEAMYLDRLLEAGGDPSWSVCGVGTLPGDRAMQEALEPQGCLYTLVLKGTDGSVRPRVIGSIARYLHAPADPETVVAKLADAATRIVSLTITEGGYHISDVTGEFEVTPDVAADLEPGAVPGTVFGLVAEALDRRRQSGAGGFTVLSCDNVSGNGEVARRSFTAYAELKDPALARWMDEHVTFPSSMVDRITPVTSDQDRRDLADRFGVDDAWPHTANGALKHQRVEAVLRLSASCMARSPGSVPTPQTDHDGSPPASSSRSRYIASCARWKPPTPRCTTPVVRPARS